MIAIRILENKPKAKLETKIIIKSKIAWSKFSKKLQINIKKKKTFQIIIKSKFLK